MLAVYSVLRGIGTCGWSGGNRKGELVNSYRKQAGLSVKGLKKAGSGGRKAGEKPGMAEIG